MRDLDLNLYKGKMFKHFKGDLYLLQEIVKHTETGEQMVVYKSLYGDCEVYVRPYDMFLEKVDKNKYPDCNQFYRFEPIVVKSVIVEKQEKWCWTCRHGRAFVKLTVCKECKQKSTEENILANWEER